MSIVHEKLYRSGNLSQIDFGEYISVLASHLISVYSTDPKMVRLDFSVGKILVDINTAIPLGLAMNELISNALKHAFSNGEGGTISIGGGEESDLITLFVRDNGVGTPAGFDWKTSPSLGLRLVINLVRQVRGTIEKGTGTGTMFTITIPKKVVVENVMAVPALRIDSDETDSADEICPPLRTVHRIGPVGVAGLLSTDL
jgi:two-component sensor histidine kinase